MADKQQKLLMGNEAMGRGLVEAGCTLVSAYPGTPSSEILGSVVANIGDAAEPLHVEWSVNEKVAFEIALSNSWLGGRSAVMMKQVGLNVALDPLMSAAYTGVKGGFIVVAADDPGPYSSQTEQDSRLLALFAKIPVFDPSTPQEAMEMVGRAFELSERFRIPVMLRPTSWVCHARQGLQLRGIEAVEPSLSLEKDPYHWAAPPRQRFRLHRELNQKIGEMAEGDSFSTLGNPEAELAVVASGVPFAHLRDLMRSLGLEELGASDKLYEEYSLGMKARLSLARALLTDPPVVILDEPTLGLDPPSARAIRELLVRLAHEGGKTVLMTTHNMFEAEIVCDRVAIIDEGRIVAVDTVEGLKRRVADNVSLEITALLPAEVPMAAVREKLAAALGCPLDLTEGEDGHRVKVVAPSSEVDEITANALRVLYEAGCRVTRVDVRRPNLEDVFIKLTKGGWA